MSFVEAWEAPALAVPELAETLSHAGKFPRMDQFTVPSPRLITRSVRDIESADVLGTVNTNTDGLMSSFPLGAPNATATGTSTAEPLPVSVTIMTAWNSPAEGSAS